MHPPPVKPWAFLARLLALFVVTYLLWEPAAPYYARFLLQAARAGVWLSELPTSSLWRSGTTLRTGSPCIGNPIGGSASGCGGYCDSAAECPKGVACVRGICDVPCTGAADCAGPCGAGTRCLVAPATAIFYYHRNFKSFDPPVPPQHIPAEWVMANLVLLIPLMLATPAPSWRLRFWRLAIAVAVAVVLQVIDVIVGIKAFYATTFRGYWSPWLASIYQFLDVFFQSWDTQLFPFAIWAGVHFRWLMELRPKAAAPATEPPRAVPVRAARTRAERRRKRGS
jgi:hypothetical protein